MHSLSEFSIKKQFQLILSCLLSLCLILGALSYIVVNSLMTKNATAYAQNTAQGFHVEMQYLCKRVDAIFTNLLFDQNIERMMVNPYSAETPAYIKKLQVQFSTYSIMNQDITDIALVTKDMTWSNFFDADTLQGFSNNLDNVYGTKSFGLRHSPVQQHNESNTQRLVFGHSVYGMHNDDLYGQYLGSIILSLNPAKSAITLPANERGAAYFVLADSTGNTFSFNASKEICKDILKQYGASDEFSSSDVQVCETKDYLIYATPMPEADSYLLSAIDRHSLNKDVLIATTMIILIVIAALLVVILLMHTILLNMVSPLGEMSKYLTIVKSSAPNMPKLPIHLSGCSEIRMLSDAFNEMIAEQSHLATQLHSATVTLYESELGKKQAELDFLRSQINPHFLYNTLESIKDIANERDVSEIAAIANAMGKLFRYNVKGSVSVTLEQELDITLAYLDIQQARFPGKLEIISSVRPNTLRIPVMKLMLQPLIENAIYHGIEPKAGKGTLFLSAKIENEILVLSIYDDGVGIPASKLSRLRHNLSNVCESRISGEHIGLLNVQHRIWLQYGEGYGITLDSNEHEGTQIVVRIPILKK